MLRMHFRSLKPLFAVAMAVFLLNVLFAFAAAAIPPSETLIPDTAQGFISSPDINALSEAFERTQFGKLTADRIMKKFNDSIEKQTRQRQEARGEYLGLTWDQLRSIAGGEAAAALTRVGDKMPVRVSFVDCSGRREATLKVIRDVTARLIKQGNKPTRYNVEGKTLRVFYDAKKNVRLSYFYENDLLFVTDDIPVIHDVMKRFLKGAAPDGRLSQDVAFVKTARRLAADDARPAMVRWFMRPIPFMEARRKMTGRKPDPDRTDLLTVFKETGFLGITGVGGRLNFDTKRYDLLQRVAAYAPRPWTKSPKMLELVNSGDLLANGRFWVPTNIATHSSLNLETLTGFDNFGPFFNATVGGGKEGIWEDTLDGYKIDEFGPRVDMRAEIIERMVDPVNGRVGRATVFTDNRPRRFDPKTKKLLPVDSDAERRMIVSRIYPKRGDFARVVNKNGQPCDPANATPAEYERARQIAEAAVREAVYKINSLEEGALFRGETSDQGVAKGEPLVKGYDIWELLEEEDDEDDDKKDPAKKPRPVKVDDGAGRRKVIPAPQAQRLESAGMCVAHGHLFYGSHLSLLVKTFQHVQEDGRPLEKDFDYGWIMKKIDVEMKDRDWKQVCARRYFRLDEESYVDYHLAQRNKLHTSDSLMAQMITELTDPNGNNPYDYSDLPDYQPVRRYLQPGGLVCRSETGKERKEWCGWMIVMFTLKKN